MHIFELDRLLSQMAQDCLDSLSASTSSLTSPQRSSAYTSIYDSSSNLNRSRMLDEPYSPLRKSIECIYTTPSLSKSTAPLAPHCYLTLDSSRRPKSASTVMLTNLNSIPPATLSPGTHKVQQPGRRNYKLKAYRSEDDIMLALRRQEEQTPDSNDEGDDVDDDDDEGNVTLCEQDRESEQQVQEQNAQPNVRALARRFEQKTNSLPGHNRPRGRTPDLHQTVHHANARATIDELPEELPDDRLTWPQQCSTPSGGIKKLVRNGWKLFTAQPQQHKKTAK